VDVVEYEAKEQMVTVNKIVCETVTETVNQQVAECVTVPYTTTIRVPVAAPAVRSNGCGGCSPCH
jgi:hypothetical protein